MLQKRSQFRTFPFPSPHFSKTKTEPKTPTRVQKNTQFNHTTQKWQKKIHMGNRKKQYKTNPEGKNLKKLYPTENCTNFNKKIYKQLIKETIKRTFMYGNCTKTKSYRKFKSEEP